MTKLRRILVVDGSRVVRATLTKHLKDDFEVIEEGDGESARQTLMLDPKIEAVISGNHLPVLEARDLLARLRISTLTRLREMPFVLIVSEIASECDREEDRERGVTGFITKTMRGATIVDCLNNLLGSAARTQSPVAPELLIGEKPLSPATGTETEKMLESEEFNALLTALSFSDPQAENVCALVFGIDNRDALLGRFGEDVERMVAARFAGLLVARLGALDLIGRCCGGRRLAIISHGVDLRQGVRFGKRVSESLASGQITIRGQKVKLTASVGVASTSDDDVSTGNELLCLANQRLDQALTCGGNTVASEYRSESPTHGYAWDHSAIKLLVALNSPEEMRSPAQIGSLGLIILPLIQVIDKELALGLPLDKIKEQLQQRAMTDNSTL